MKKRCFFTILLLETTVSMRHNLCFKYFIYASILVAASANELAANSTQSRRVTNKVPAHDTNVSPTPLASLNSSLGPEVECFENRLEALETGRQCSRRCRKDVPCENARKQCLCDGLCGLSCIKPDLNCPELAQPEHGHYKPRGTRFGTTIKYACQAGFYLYGSQERTCMGDEDWDGKPAECLAEPQCRNPIKVSHARNPNDGLYRLNDQVNYSCYPGYEAHGSSSATCRFVKHNHTAWLWSGAPFRCVPKSCADPGQIDNGKRHGEFFTISSSVLYACNEGFEMIGQARRYCQSDNQWSGQAPRCEPVTCSPTDHLENGKINYAYPLIYNSTVEYACDYGFKLVGLRTRSCGAERKLVGDVPVCVEIDCGELGPLHNGYVRGYSSRIGDKRQFVCLDGTEFVGKQNESQCLETGQWSSGLPQCLGPCRVPTIENAKIVHIVPRSLVALYKAHWFNMTYTRVVSTTNQNLRAALEVPQPKPGTMVSHGSMLDVICEQNYELDEQLMSATIADTDPAIIDNVSNSFINNNDVSYGFNYSYNATSAIQLPVCNNSTWSFAPKCNHASCSAPPPSPKNGRVRLTSTSHGAKGFIYCLDGYNLIGSNTTVCDRGKWTATNSMCAERLCGYPGSIENGRVLLVGLTGMYEYKSYIKRISNNRQIAYECDAGYRTSEGAPIGATCIDGVWRPEGLPSCVKE